MRFVPNINLNAASVLASTGISLETMAQTFSGNLVINDIETFNRSISMRPLGVHLVLGEGSVDADEATEELASDPEIMASISRGEADVSAGRTVAWRDIRRD